MIHQRLKDCQKGLTNLEVYSNLPVDEIRHQVEQVITGLVNFSLV